MCVGTYLAQWNPTPKLFYLFNICPFYKTRKSEKLQSALFDSQKKVLLQWIIALYLGIGL